MRKFPEKTMIVFFSSLLLLFSLTSCSSKQPNNPTNTSPTGTVNSATQNPPTGTADNLIKSTGTTNTTTPETGTYTKEFSYLPAYSNMYFQSISQPDQNQMVTARYLVKNTTTDKILNDYGAILKKDGWTVNWSYTKDKKPYSIYAQKDKHIAIIISEPKGNDVLLIIGSK